MRKSYTPSTLTDPGELRLELLRIRAVGHAFDDERVSRLAALVREAAADASRALGGAEAGRD
ncbi:MAG: hypothetical protein HYU25_08690 [Candidatus Rokubacteria bacterium]|nr:hypothetical protein [Candidatus Rokubacteria bacterium]